MTTLLIEDFIFINKIILRLGGLYPTDFSRYLLCLFLMSLIIVPEIFEIYLNRDNFDVILETSSVLLTILLAIFKSIIWMTQKETPNFVRFLINDYWILLTSLGESEDIYEFIRSAKNITVGYSVLIVNALLIFFSLPLINIAATSSNNSKIGKFHHPFPGFYPEFCYYSPAYELIYVSQVLATTICGLIILATDTLIATALLHSCAHFFVLKKNISTIDFDKNDGKSWRHVNYRLRIVVQHHQVILRFCERMEMLFNSLMLLQVLASSLIICLVGFQMNSAKLDKLPQYSSYLMMALFQLLLFCWPGDQLISQSSSVSTAAYSSNWYKSPISTQRKIHSMIKRSQESCSLSAGKFSPMNLENFCKILSNSLSYFMLLRSVSNED